VIVWEFDRVVVAFAFAVEFVVAFAFVEAFVGVFAAVVGKWGVGPSSFVGFVVGFVVVCVFGVLSLLLLVMTF
jgi:hypothetical protein